MIKLQIIIHSGAINLAHLVSYIEWGGTLSKICHITKLTSQNHATFYHTLVVRMIF